MTDGNLLMRLLPVVLQHYDASDSIADVLQNARRKRAQRLKAKKLKWLLQRKAIIISSCSVLFEFLNLLVELLTCPHVACLSRIFLAILSKTSLFCFRLDRLDVSLIPFKLLLYCLLSPYFNQLPPSLYLSINCAITLPDLSTYISAHV